MIRVSIAVALAVLSDAVVAEDDAQQPASRWESLFNRTESTGWRKIGNLANQSSENR